jgi:hypothetical protein
MALTGNDNGMSRMISRGSIRPAASIAGRLKKSVAILLPGPTHGRSHTSARSEDMIEPDRIADVDNTGRRIAVEPEADVKIDGLRAELGRRCRGAQGCNGQRASDKSCQIEETHRIHDTELSHSGAGLVLLLSRHIGMEEMGDAVVISI